MPHAAIMVRHFLLDDRCNCCSGREAEERHAKTRVEPQKNQMMTATDKL